jgi:hypothetical protein
MGKVRRPRWQRLALALGAFAALPVLRADALISYDGSVTLPAAGYDYGVQRGNLHRWDLHPLE